MNPDPPRSTHRARKRFGQNFLADQSILARLLAAIAPRADHSLLEIGPGLGALTRPLLDSGAAVHAIEIDRDLAARFDDPAWTELVLYNRDALEIDLCELALNASVERWRVAGNLPYNISTPLLLQLVQHHRCISDAHLMLQREVVDRLAATPGNRDYGRLGILVQRVFEVERLFDVPPTAFRPQPKVMSAIVRLRVRDEVPSAEQLDALSAATRIGFAQRRKTLRNNFRGVLEEQELKALGIDPAARAETLSADAFERIASALIQR